MVECGLKELMAPPPSPRQLARSAHIPCLSLCIRKRFLLLGGGGGAQSCGTGTVGAVICQKIGTGTVISQTHNIKMCI
jgi:hypothetical protein